jgi:hypothetical protein
MFADDRLLLQPIGHLSADLHLPVEWRSTLVGFIAAALPAWRDDPGRPPATAETVLTSQLCGFLNSATRRSQGWDCLQFRVEERDEIARGRAIDLVAAPSGVVIWIEGRQYSHYEALFPIECKRLPTPVGAGRDEREYLHSRHGSRGGVQRFKAGDHGAAHDRAALIAYLQAENIGVWHPRIAQWIIDLSAETAEWTTDDMIHLCQHEPRQRIALLSSQHRRSRGLGAMDLDHLWIEM